MRIYDNLFKHIDTSGYEIYIDIYIRIKSGGSFNYINTQNLPESNIQDDFMIGYIAGTLTTIAFAPQLIKALHTKSTGDVSLLMLICSTAGMALWLIHGLIIHDNALIIANAISVTLAFSLLVYKVKNEL